MPVPVTADFGHPARCVRFWRRLVAQALPQRATPFYLFSARPVAEALTELEVLARGSPVPVRHWLSCKTQPLPPLLRWWHARGGGVEVVSEFEFLAAGAEGYPPDRILVNGPAKHHWLPKLALRGLRVVFDSVAEAEALSPVARRLDWSVGCRLLTREEQDPETPRYPTQFGLTPPELVALVGRLRAGGVRVETLHFHLRTNVASPSVYERALAEVAAMCRRARWWPRHLDCGGGMPAPWVLSREGRRCDAAFDLGALAGVYRRALPRFPGLEELWLENGRFVSARSGVLVVRVLDVKERRGMRHLICDGGRTTNALIAQWEQHALLSVPARRGPGCLTTVCGPTCMAFDQLARGVLPRGVRAGDCLVWLDAGAYHIPWETRFSHGWSEVVWHEGERLQTVRPRESFARWWGVWR